MIDAVEIINRFTEYNPSKGELPLPLPIPGHWFRKICALADRIAAAENDNESLRVRLKWSNQRIAELEDACNLETETSTNLGMYLDQARRENEKLIALVNEQNTKLQSFRWIDVRERLPELGGQYLVTSKMINDTWECSYTQYCGWHTKFEPSHWMPLPEPPK